MVNYQIRYSKKAKYLQLRISAIRGLEVVIPARYQFLPEVIEKFLVEKRQWIERNYSRLRQSENRQADSLLLPEFIFLHAIQQRWQVSYLATTSHKLDLITNPSRQITLVGNIQNKERCLQILREWVKKMAEHWLTQHLDDISKNVGLPFQSMTIRNNATRWGSCSNKKNISLCCKLLFIPPKLMHHVLLHELCHTKIMHHGKSFWNLMEQFDQLARDNAKQLRKAVKEIPHWINAR
jgi:predicted metal-dependent hydrolase